MDVDEIARDTDRHGKIIVEVERGDLVKTEPSKKGDRLLWDAYQPPDTRISSKEVVKDNHISHAIG